MPHVISYDRMESVDHILIRFDKEGEMRVVVGARLTGKSGSHQRHSREAKLNRGQKDMILSIIRNTAAELDVEVPEWAKEKKQ